jgi:hypothetical protein
MSAIDSWGIIVDAGVVDSGVDAETILRVMDSNFKTFEIKSHF